MSAAGPDVATVRRHLIGTPSPVLTGPTHAFEAAASSDPRWNDELPGTGLEVVIELSGGWDLELDGRRVSTEAFASGLLAGRVRTQARGAVRLVQLSIDPLAAPALFGVPAGELTATAVDLEALMGRGAASLLDQLDETWARRLPVDPDRARARAPGPPPRDPAVAMVETFVARTIRDATEDSAHRVPADVRRACDLLRACGGTMRIERVAAELGCSRRHLTRRFRTFVGVSPSEFNRLLRFERATAALRRDPRVALSRLAFECGYADHAHMTREFVTLAGAPPSVVAQRFH